MAHDYEGKEREFIIIELKHEAERYEAEAEKCLVRIFESSENADVLAQLAWIYAKRVDAYNIMIKDLQTDSSGIK